MYVMRENIYIYVFSFLKCKMYLYLYDSIRRYLHYATVKFKMQIYIYIARIEIA
jgi:hypothetical protein